MLAPVGGLMNSIIPNRSLEIFPPVIAGLTRNLLTVYARFPLGDPESSSG